MIGSTTPTARQHDAEPGRPPIELSPAALRKDAPRITPRPVTITYSRSLARLDALAGGDFDIGASVEPAFTIQARNLKLQPRPKVARLR